MQHHCPTVIQARIPARMLWLQRGSQGSAGCRKGGDLGMDTLLWFMAELPGNTSPALLLGKMGEN